jgi:hypothetical protein
MIRTENGQKKYFDRNGKEIKNGYLIKYLHGDRSLERTERVYMTADGELGIDATNPSWVERGLAVPCEFGIYPLGNEETNNVEVVEGYVS